MGGPRLCHSWHAKPISPGSQGFGSDVRGDLGELAGKHHGWFSDGIRFPSPLTMPKLVAFPDQAPYITRLGDRRLKLTTLTQFHDYLQEEPEQFNPVDQRVIQSETVSQGGLYSVEAKRFSSDPPISGKFSPTLSERPER